MRIVGGERAWAAAFEISAMQIGVTVINDLRTVGMIERHDMLCGYANIFICDRQYRLYQ